jgi:hypothetical protein
MGTFVSFEGVIHDAAGYHITVGDSERVIDVAENTAEQQIVFDEEYNLYKIYDAEGHITAEYDPGQSKEGDPDYVPATGWVDIQKLATDLVCSRGDGTSCINPNTRPQFANSVWFESVSTGVYKYKEVKDNTGVVVGEVLLLQLTSKDINKKPTTIWVLTQAESSLEPGANKYRAFAQEGFMNEGLDMNADGGRIVDIAQWLKWNKKGDKLTLSFLRSGRSYTDFLGASGTKTYNVNASSFLNNGGSVSDIDESTVIAANGSASTD